MYQTRGLFYPSLSQRVYQSNQGLKLAAKAVCHTKGEFICLKSFRLPNDSNIDMKHNRHCFVVVPSLSLPPSFSYPRTLFGRRCSPDWSLPCPPAVPNSQTCLRVDAAVSTRFGIHTVHLRIWADRTCPCQLHPCLCQFQHISLRNMNNVKHYPPLLTGIRWQSFRCMLSLLSPDRQLCFTLIAIYLLSSSL